jgi:hypothetical protein
MFEHTDNMSSIDIVFTGQTRSGRFHIDVNREDSRLTQHCSSNRVGATFAVEVFEIEDHVFHG